MGRGKKNITDLREKCVKQKITIECCQQKLVSSFLSVKRKENDLNRKYMLLAGAYLTPASLQRCGYISSNYFIIIIIKKRSAMQG